MTKFEPLYKLYEVQGESPQIAKLGDDILSLSTVARTSSNDPDLKSGTFYYTVGQGSLDFMIKTKVFDRHVESKADLITPQFELSLDIQLLPDADTQPLIAKTMAKILLESVAISGGRFETLAGALVEPPVDIPADRFPVTVSFMTGEKNLEIGELPRKEQRLVADSLIRSLYARYELANVDPKNQWTDEVSEPEPRQIDETDESELDEDTESWFTGEDSFADATPPENPWPDLGEPEPGLSVLDNRDDETDYNPAIHGGISAPDPTYDPFEREDPIPEI
jgi:hypothetical protein